jgi:hypothetical protein
LFAHQVAFSIALKAAEMSGRWSSLLADGTAAAAEFLKELNAKLDDEGFEPDDALLGHVLEQMRALPDKATLLEELVEVFEDGSSVDIGNW